ncbi:putative enzyme [Rhodococcus sp. RD6.2]|jgi:3-oxoacyl-[acyl-carrier protein] reductase|uniref:SDR family oxidoreductase n=1 Tax=unclassified Rhodococcus (in: high G+C Gram-positive bacteria) TaxID=192944 RepID=UPI00063B56D7|nr:MULTISPECIES: SDR family oxidoreductase [unclassified Rhodococcus (in: high G+C Gram-positive bacteria)]CRK54299.1 putative enzyme [Rhodococcus sp. RD6.2]
MGRFDGRTAIVTGAAQGIGEVYAQRLAADGANVVVADLNAELGEQVAKQIVADGGSAFFQQVDVSDGASAQALADATIEKFGGIDHLVNNAAIYGGMKIDSLLTVDWDYYRRFMSVNMDGALQVCRAVVPHMRAKGGSIVNQSSTAAWTYSNYYGLAKAGINSLTQQLATELGWSKIRINAIAPGPIDTEATRTSTPKVIVDQIVSRIPLQRMGTPEDLAGLCLFLLSDEASWISGQIYNVDGGQVYRS